MSTTFAQTIDGNYIYAQRAVQDKNGDDIDQTYAKSASLATVATTGSYADLSNKPTIPTVDQTYDGTSTNAQSGTAVAGAIATKEDEFDVGTGLEMDTSGSTPTLQVEAPVDIVAGPGIVIDNPDGNTLRVSTDENYETVLWENASGAAPSAFPVTLSETTANFERVKFYFRPWSSNDCVVEKMGNQTLFMLESTWINTNQTVAPYSFLDVLSASGTQLSFSRGCFNQWSATSITEDTTQFRLYKVVGIHRIAGGN